VDQGRKRVRKGVTDGPKEGSVALGKTLFEENDLGVDQGGSTREFAGKRISGEDKATELGLGRAMKSKQEGVCDDLSLLEQRFLLISF